MTTYTVHLGDPAQPDAPVIGQLSYGPGGQLAVASAVADREAFLRDVVARTNQLDKLHETVSPPPGSARHTITKRPVERHDPQFRAALKEYLQRYFMLKLVPEDPEPEDAAGPETARQSPAPAAKAEEEPPPTGSNFLRDLASQIPPLNFTATAPPRDQPPTDQPPEAESDSGAEAADEPGPPAEPPAPPKLPERSRQPVRSAVHPAKLA
jgi:hypothetical protein